MIAEKTNTANQIIEKISGGPKVDYISHELLSRAMVRLENYGIPTNKNEDYKYCNMDAILKREFRDIRQQFQPVATVANYKLEDTITLVVVNGRISEELSDKVIVKGLYLTSFSNLDGESRKLIGSLADVDSDAFIALNTAFSGEGFFIKVAKDISIPMPLHIIYVSSAGSEAVVNTRNLIQLEENSRLTIIEEHVTEGNGKIFTNYLSEKIVASGAELYSYIFQAEGKNSYSVNTNQVVVEKNAKYANATITLGGQLVRNNHNVALNSDHCEAHLNGLFSVKGNALVDNHTLMDHRFPNCESNELYKGIINEKGTGVFNGKIFVRRDAQKTNAYQSSKNILLSDDATINTKPQLEIYADDVKCSHGTSTGKIDEEAMFYLNARGIGKESARKLLLASFALEVIGKIEVESLREKITGLFENEI